MAKNFREKRKILKTAVYTIVKCKEEFLLLHRIEDFDVWEFPGGKIEFGQTPRETALKELREETGIKARDVKLFGATSVIYPDGKTMQICIFYLLEIPKKVSPFLSEHAEFKWVTLEKAFKLNLALSALSLFKNLKNEYK